MLPSFSLLWLYSLKKTKERPTLYGSEVENRKVALTNSKQASQTPRILWLKARSTGLKEWQIVGW